MMRPIERTILQSIGNVLFDSGLEIYNILISPSRVFEVADIEAELINHRLHARNPKFHICRAEVHLIVAGVFGGKEIRNGQMPNANASHGHFISIE